MDEQMRNRLRSILDGLAYMASYAGHFKELEFINRINNLNRQLNDALADAEGGKQKISHQGMSASEALSQRAEVAYFSLRR